MRTQDIIRAALAATLIYFLVTSTSHAADWITAPSYYTHDPQSGERLQQYTPIGPFYTYSRGDFRRSGYRNTRSSIQVGGSADHYHVVEEWGRPVRPYGEWRFPYRPYSVPYDAWGPPVPQVLGIHGGFGRGPGRRGRGAAAPGPGPGPAPGPTPTPPTVPPELQFRRYPGYLPQPYDDGRYAPYDSDGPYGYPDLLQRRDRGLLVRPPENFGPRP